MNLDHVNIGIIFFKKEVKNHLNGNISIIISNITFSISLFLISYIFYHISHYLTTLHIRYGNFNEISKYIYKYVLNKSDKSLIIGCGNSEFSSEYYDAGYKSITNLDFSDLVIEEMKFKNDKIRPLMSWDVGDMTYMPQYDGNLSI
jgi:hypothetical protein